MKKNLFLLFVFLITLTTLTSCKWIAIGPGVGDIEQELINNYVLFRINGNNYVIEYENQEDDNKPYVSVSNVIRYCNNSRHIGIQKINVIAQATRLDLDTISQDEIQYYLIDTEQHTLSSQLTKEEFNEYCIKLGVNDLSEWTESIKK